MHQPVSVFLQCSLNTWLKELASGDQRRLTGSGSVLEACSRRCAVQIHNLLYSATSPACSALHYRKTNRVITYLGDRSALFHHRREIFRVQLVDVRIGDEYCTVSALGKAIRLSTPSSHTSTDVVFETSPRGQFVVVLALAQDLWPWPRRSRPCPWPWFEASPWPLGASRSVFCGLGIGFGLEGPDLALDLSSRPALALDAHRCQFSVPWPRRSRPWPWPWFEASPWPRGASKSVLCGIGLAFGISIYDVGLGLEGPDFGVGLESCVHIFGIILKLM